MSGCEVLPVLEFAEPLREGVIVRREVFLGQSKLDFLVGNAFLEVKTPLQHLQVELPAWVKTRKSTPFSSTGRMQRHVGELARSLENHQRAVLLACCIYDNPGFEVVKRSTDYEEVKATMDASVERGAAVCQANFRIAPDGVTLQKVMPVAS
ncbi:MAG: DNA/RNA nuclease SfsA [Eggerthellaceae bacterium]|nr:DNA/RNA nuclease SfsA [Eggerthellaceae bacterium]